VTYKTGTELVEEARTRIREIAASEAVALRESKPDVVYLDVREPSEWAMGHVAGAVFVPRGQIESKIEALVPRERKIVVYCARANRSALAADTLQQLGYSDVYSLAGGFGAWVDAGGEIEE
jgi:rhodanese-related sulfurtransferase